MKKRLISGLLVVCILCGMLPTTFVTASAETVTTPETQEETTPSYQGIIYGNRPFEGWDPETQTYSYIYYGKWKNLDDTEPQPLKWRVLDRQLNGALAPTYLVMSEKILGYNRSDLNLRADDYMSSSGGIYFEKTGTSLGEVSILDSLLDMVGGNSNLLENYKVYGYTTMYQASDLRNWFTDFAGVTTNAYTGRYGLYVKGGVQPAFTSKELSYIAPTSRNDAGYTGSKDYYGFEFATKPYTGILKQEKVFPLSVEEAESEAYGFGGSDATKEERLRAAGEALNGPLKTTWLRSFTMPYLDGRMACAVQTIGSEGAYTKAYPNFYMDFSGDIRFSEDAGDWANDAGVRPAFNLDTSKIYMTKPADDRVQQNLDLINNTMETPEWKLVMLDQNQTMSAQITADHAEPGKTLTVTHKALSAYAGNYTNITATILDADGNIVAYGSITDDLNATKTAMLIPELADGIYTIRLQAEQWNGAYATDYSTCDYYSITLPIYTPHVHDGVEWTAVTTADELAAMGPDDYAFLVTDIDCDASVKCHVCCGDYSLELVSESAVVYNCDDSTGKLSKVSILPNCSLICQSGQMGFVSCGINSYLEIRSTLGSAHLYDGATIVSAGPINTIEAENNCTITCEGDVETITAKKDCTIVCQNVDRVELLYPGSTLEIKGAAGYVSDWDNTNRITLHNGVTVETLYLNGDLECLGQVTIKDAYVYFDGRILINAAFGVTQPIIVHQDRILDYGNQVFTENWAKYMGDKDPAEYFLSASWADITLDSTGELVMIVGSDRNIRVQPTKENDYTVTVNYPTGAVYQWYSAKREDRWLTSADKNTIYTGRTNTSYDADEDAWIVSVSDQKIAAFLLRLNKGDTIRIYPVGESYIEKMELAGSPLIQKDGYWELTAEDTISEAALFIFYAKASEAKKDGVKVQLQGTAIGDALPGQSSAKLNTNGLADGNYICTVTWARKPDVTTDDITRTSQWVNLSRQTETAAHTDHCVCSGLGYSSAHGSCETLQWIPWTYSSKLPDQPGNYYLVYDVTLFDTYTAPDGINICMNGKNIYLIGSAIYVKNAVVNITDCCGTGKIDALGNRTWYGIQIGETGRNSGNLAMFHITLTGVNALYHTILVEYGSSLTIVNCNITNNKADDKGGGVYVNGDFHMWGGSITGNTAGTTGGGISVSGVGIARVDNGLITGNTAGTNGGGVFVSYSSTNGYGKFTMYSGTITDNTAGAKGGGLYSAGTAQNNGAYIEMSGKVIISWNEAGGARSNFYIAGGTPRISGLLEDSMIGVLANVATGGNYKVSNSSASKQYIFSDKTTYQLYAVSETPGDGLNLVKEKDHDCAAYYTFTVEEDGYTAHCSCGATATAKIVMPTEPIYFDGTPKEIPVLKFSPNWICGGVVITYENNVNVGTATVTVSHVNMPEFTRTLTFTIEKAPTLSADCFKYTAPTKAPYVGINKTAKVEPLVNVGKVTVHHVPIGYGYYKIYIDVAETENHEAVYGLSDPAWIYCDRVDVGISKVSLRPTKEGVYFTGKFAIDECVPVSRYGIAVSVSNKTPVADDTDPTSLWTNGTNSVLISNILKADKSGRTVIYARAYVLTEDGTYFYGEVVAVNMKTLVQQIDTRYYAIDTNSRIALKQMCHNYRDSVSKWELENVLDPLVTVIHRYWTVEDTKNGTFTGGEGSIVVTELSDAEFGDTVYCKTIAKTGYTAQKSNLTIVADEDVTVCFDYYRTAYNLTLDAGEGILPCNEASTYTMLVYYGETTSVFDSNHTTGSGLKGVKAEYLPKGNGYLFYSWYNGADRVTDEFVMPASNVTLTADWVSTPQDVLTQAQVKITDDKVKNYTLNTTVFGEDLEKMCEYGIVIVSFEFYIKELDSGYQEVTLTANGTNGSTVLYENLALETAGTTKGEETFSYNYIMGVKDVNESFSLRLYAHGENDDDYNFKATITIDFATRY